MTTVFEFLRNPVSEPLGHQRHLRVLTKVNERLEAQQNLVSVSDRQCEDLLHLMLITFVLVAAKQGMMQC